jgi:hypothetical protein
MLFRTLPVAPGCNKTQNKKNFWQPLKANNGTGVPEFVRRGSGTARNLGASQSATPPMLHREILQPLPSTAEAVQGIQRAYFTTI